MLQGLLSFGLSKAQEDLSELRKPSLDLLTFFTTIKNPTIFIVLLLIYTIAQGRGSSLCETIRKDLSPPEKELELIIPQLKTQTCKYCDMQQLPYVRRREEPQRQQDQTAHCISVGWQIAGRIALCFSPRAPGMRTYWRCSQCCHALVIIRNSSSGCCNLLWGRQMPSTDQRERDCKGNLQPSSSTEVSPELRLLFQKPEIQQN